jgi:phosphate/sulfate permease
MKKDVLIRAALLLASGAALIALPISRVHAQSCAMCYQGAAASGAQGGTALRHGILLLFVPAISLFVGIFALIYRRRNVAR